MDTSNIPKTFWHSLSVAVLACTAMLLVIAYRSTDVSIRIANAKIDLKRGVAEVERLNKDLEAENERLKAAQDRLEQKYQEIERTLKRPGTVRPEDLPKLDPREFEFKRPMIERARFDRADQHLQRVLRGLD